jgi:hypothetical protein
METHRESVSTCETQQQWQDALHKALGLKVSLVCRNIWVTIPGQTARLHRTGPLLDLRKIANMELYVCTFGLHETLKVILSRINATTLTTRCWLSRPKL